MKTHSFKNQIGWSYWKLVRSINYKKLVQKIGTHRKTGTELIILLKISAENQFESVYYKKKIIFYLT